MSQINKRTLLGLTAAAALTVVVGCGKKEEAAPQAAAPAAAPAAAEPLKVAWVYVSPVGDGGWTYGHDLGRKAVEAEFGDKVKTSFVEKVPEGADAERVLRDLAAQGNKLIFTTSFGFMEPTIKVAQEFPDVKFMHATGYKTAPNVGVYDVSFYEDAYISGLIAGATTKTNTLGFVGAFPIPEVLRNLNAFTLGAQAVNPKVQTKVVWINSWFDPPKEAEAGQSLVNAGADVVLAHADSSAVLQTMEKLGKHGFGWDSDMSAVAPKAHLASNVMHMAPVYIKYVKEVMDGSWKPERTIFGTKEGVNEVIKITDNIPEDLKKRIDTVKAGLKDGSFAVFTGPIVDNTGKERLAQGVVADQAWKDSVDFFVKGVEGKVPSGK